VEGIDTRVVDLYSIKPIDKELVFKCIKETGNIVVLEDHLMDCGLASVISDTCLDEGIYPKKFKRLGIPQIYAGFGSGEQLRHKYGYDKDAVVAAIKKMLK
jgi:transketolase